MVWCPTITVSGTAPPNFAVRRDILNGIEFKGCYDQFDIIQTICDVGESIHFKEEASTPSRAGKIHEKQLSFEFFNTIIYKVLRINL
ncbi:MAG: hypothetical protein MJE68_15140 [Proteobacteria bacterium]|nr:hypothetical protein [Pseudomonadota bacterium]